ncbi:MAG: protein-export chaperone SecB [Candidatus Pelagibacterales bacterium]|jgi:preprotein translocase subunit SecB|nr:protein-export chaperone SecB [Pelagibacterales bacterium]MDA7763485.1 protein-export chaperone SecB [Pelagibacterales bacterium]MDA9864748.1 protein-export chaperone SecB [Pelagibacterales bacterium]MDA9980757.1 protein-export chaperone SecB [Pelagibacterales bacterium]MDB4220187.1 protein-export chaperone SecB [Pelagibacterales bacterium]|tara:strand:+ start:4105 stop:4536 length:432 start_codon:yes stop_codon:yes gene_type:complete
MDVKTKIISQYIKDLSFENPKGPFPFANKEDRPAISVTVDVKANATSKDNLFEVILSINVAATHQDNSVFLIDLVYQGVFEFENLTDDIKEPYLLVECPRILFPFARRIIYDLHADGGLPPLLLDTVNFAELYKNRKEQSEVN